MADETFEQRQLPQVIRAAVNAAMDALAFGDSQDEAWSAAVSAYWTARHPDESFGTESDAPFRRGTISDVEPGERYVEMGCCGFRYSADHLDSTSQSYTCPLCEADDEARYLLSDKAMHHVESGCHLPPGHDGACDA